MERIDRDYWEGRRKISQQITSPDVVTIQTLPIVPLDQQFEAHPVLCVPSSLSDMLCFDQLKLFAIIDAARIEGFVEQLEAFDVAYQCLFHGEAAEKLRDVAPYLVQLHSDSSLLRRLFTRADGSQDWWDREAFILIQSNATLDELQKQLRRFTCIMDEHRTEMYFRFWDTHILLKLMTAATQDFLDPLLLFGPPQGPCITSFITPNPIADTVTIVTPNAAISPRPFMRSKALMQVLRDHVRERFALTLIAHCAPRFPETFARLEHKQQTAMMADAIATAEKLNLTKRGPVTSFMEMRLVLGVGVHNDPMYPWVSDMLGQTTEHNQMDMAEALARIFSGYNTTVNGPDNSAFFAALKRAQATLDDPEESSYLAMLKRVFPEKFNWIGADAAQALLVTIRHQLIHYPNLDTQSVRAYILLCYFMGHRCAQDPQYAWIGPTLERSVQTRDANSPLVRKCHTWLAAIFEKKAV